MGDFVYQCYLAHLNLNIQGEILNRSELVTEICSSEIFRHWHWFSWHFEHVKCGVENLLADSVISACLRCEDKIPGYATKFIKTIGSIGGKEKFIPHWEQLLQHLSELMVVAHIVSYDWPEGTKFESEPSTKKNGKNPEIIVRSPDIHLAVEVKAPAYLAHHNNRTTNSIQLASRFVPQERLSEIVGDVSTATMPRDNPMKDFLVSAESKFSQFTSEEKFVGILVIVWDDFVYEPISALQHSSCGLFTGNSFHRDVSGNAISYPSVGGVVVIRHLHQLVRTTRSEPLFDGMSDPMIYSVSSGFPPKAFVENPLLPLQRKEIFDIFEAHRTDAGLGTEYTPKELIWWF